MTDYVHQIYGNTTGLYCQHCGSTHVHAGGVVHSTGCPMLGVSVGHAKGVQGWQCPLCKRVYAPHVDVCRCADKGIREGGPVVDPSF